MVLVAAAVREVMCVEESNVMGEMVDDSMVLAELPVAMEL
jgi:hypothetical protein